MKTQHGRVKRGPEEPARVRVLRRLLDILHTKRRREIRFSDRYQAGVIDERIRHVEAMLDDLEKREGNG
ncbi:MAG TPA: hypothetical protein VN688_02135 [Gemmataceae bacterium]|nr:hypothetical protein [Gemmataceae bacterium]